MNEKTRHVDGVSRRDVLKTSTIAVGCLAVTGIATASEGGATTQTEDVYGQGPEGDVVMEDGATLRRTNDAIQAKVQMPTPQPGSYDYPDPEGPTVSEEGHPEGFSLWVFVFDDELGGFGDNPWSSAFFGAGHMVGGDTLTLSGQINENSEPFVGFPLENPREAEVHLAVAPHGGLDPDLMPDQIKTPGGGPEHWWFAVFESPA